MAMTGSTSPISIESSRREVACLRCRSRKTACSKEHPKCYTCRDGNHDCLYPDQDDKVIIWKSRLNDLEARLRKFESATQAQSTIEVHSLPTTLPENPPDIEVNPLMTGIADLSISPSGNPRESSPIPYHGIVLRKLEYLGISSSLALGLRLQDIVRAFRPADRVLDIEREHPTYNPEAMRPRRHSMICQIELPPYQFALRLFAAQFTYIGTIFAFVPKATFEPRLKRTYEGPPDLTDREACLAYAEVLVLLAFGQMYSVNQWNGSDGPPGFGYFTHALQYLPDIHEDGSILFVEVLSLVGYFMQNLNRRDAAFVYVGVALRMAISLALHQEVYDPRMNEAEREHRRRLWWSVYSLDRILCAKSGNPITINDEDIGVKLPSPLPGIEPKVCPATTLLHYTALSKILGRIMKTIYRKTRKTGTTLIASVQQIMSSLAAWHRDVPGDLRFHPEKLAISRESVSTFLHYYQCINMTARPLLFHVVQQRLAAGLTEKEQDWRQGLSQPTISVIYACMSAAANTTSMMTVAAQKGLVATYGYMDGEHAFSAAAVLVMVGVAFPLNQVDVVSIDTSLELLRSMADKGNTHMGAKLDLLLRLRSLVPRTDAQDDALPAESQAFNPEAIGMHSTFEVQDFTAMDDTELEELFTLDSDTLDFGIWEAGYTNADVSMEQEIAQWKDTMQDW